MSYRSELDATRERTRALEAELRLLESGVAELGALARRRAEIAHELAEVRRVLDATKRSLLPRVRMAGPCPEDWGSMVGDNRERHCGRCDKAVHNLSAMTATEVETLLAARGASGMCARYYQRADGMIMTSDCTASRFSRWFGATIAALVVATLGFSVWQRFGTTVRSGRIAFEPRSSPPQVSDALPPGDPIGEGETR